MTDITREEIECCRKELKEIKLFLEGNYYQEKWDALCDAALRSLPGPATDNPNDGEFGMPIEHRATTSTESSAAQHDRDGEGPIQGDTVPLAASAAGPATADQLEKDLLRATSIGMATILTVCGAYSELSPYMKKQYDELEALHAKCDRAFAATADQTPINKIIKACADIVRLPISEELVADYISRHDVVTNVLTIRDAAYEQQRALAAAISSQDADTREIEYLHRALAAERKALQQVAHERDALLEDLRAERKAREEAERMDAITKDAFDKMADKCDALRILQVGLIERAEAAERENAELRQHAEAMSLTAALASVQAYAEWKGKQEKPHD